MIEGLVTGRYRLRADAAPLVFEAAHAGDAVAQGLIEWAAEALASMVFGVARQMQATGEAVEIVLGGSFFKAGPILIDPLKAHILAEVPAAQFVHVDADPVVGAVLLAMRCDGLANAAILSARTHLLTQS
jgi:N-acetylglucosamine kinase-like BadF-type ATPase